MAGVRFYEAARFAPTNHLVLPMGLFISGRTLESLRRSIVLVRAQARAARSASVC